MKKIKRKIKMDKTEKMWIWGGLFLTILGKYGSYYHPSSYVIMITGIFFIIGSQIILKK
jgi:hypothetical protein